MSEKTLSDVLEGYALETQAGDDLEVLQRWMTENPEFAEDLMDFAAARSQMRHIDADISAEEEARYAQFGKATLERVLSGTVELVLESLTSLAQEKGLRKSEFAAKLGLSVSLTMYLEKRRLQFATIPDAIVKRISDVLEITERSVSSYLRLPATAGEASFKAATRPGEVTQKSFAEAVSEDQSLPPAEKQKLLELE